MTMAGKMPNVESKATFDLHVETPGHTSPPFHESNEELEIAFSKTIEGHYRHGSTGYRRVGVLFLTWEEDDMQCKETEVDHLRTLFAEKFKYETYYFQIPSSRWRTALQKEIADLLHQFDFSDCLFIVYYGGHGELDKETQSLSIKA
ncbi:MAG: hypothetical protein Q9224_002534 [Gallowayella concinna]